MIPAKFDYLAPTSVEEALSALSQSDDAKVIAGGQSLLPVLRMRLNAPELLVDIGGHRHPQGDPRRRRRDRDRRDGAVLRDPRQRRR